MIELNQILKTMVSFTYDVIRPSAPSEWIGTAMASHAIATAVNEKLVKFKVIFYSYVHM